MISQLYYTYRVCRLCARRLRCRATVLQNCVSWLHMRLVNMFFLTSYCWFVLWLCLAGCSCGCVLFCPACLCILSYLFLLSASSWRVWLVCLFDGSSSCVSFLCPITVSSCSVWLLCPVTIYLYYVLWLCLVACGSADTCCSCVGGAKFVRA